MEEVAIQANRREIVGKHVKTLRREGKLPAVLYGHQIETIPIELDFKESTQLLEGLSPSALVVVHVDGKEHHTLVREKQRDVLRGSILHVDFQAVSLTDKVRANVAIDLVGEAPAVKELGGILLVNLDQVDVESLPRDLPDHIEVDISILEEIGDTLYVRDLSFSGDIVIHDDLDEIIVAITMPTAEPEPEEEEIEEVEEVPEDAEPEVIERGKREEEEEATAE